MAHIYKRTRSPFWQARITVGNTTKRISTGCTDKREAKKAAEQVEQELNTQLASTADIHLLAAAERFFNERCDLKPKTVRNYHSNLANLISKLGDFPLRVLNKDRIKHYIEVRLTECGSVAIRRDLAFLSSVYKTAMGWTNGPEHNPIKDFDKSHLKNASERTRWLTTEEFEKLLDACQHPHHRTILLLLVETGLRVQELFNLEWSNVDFNNRQLIIFGDKTKNGDYRIVPLTQTAFGTLRDTHVEGAEGPVLVNKTTRKPYTTFHKNWSGICRRGGVANCTIHTLRHTFASWALQRGVSEIVIQHWLGHKTRSMTKRYAKPSYDTLQYAASVFSGDTLRDTRDLTVK